MVVLLVGLPVGGYLYANHQFQKIDEVPVGDELAGSAEGTNYLLVGTDSRPGVEGNRSDTMLVLRVEDGAGTMMSIPRDLLVSIPGRDGENRINAAYNDGPVTLVRTVQQSLGIPLDRYVEIDFDSFGGVVDAVGGVTIDFPNPATDPKSGLNVQETGPVKLDGAQALAYVRSRTYTEVINGETVVDGTGDLGRVKRQQTFLRAVLGEAGESRNPFALARVGRALTGGLKIDDHMTLLDALRFAWDMGKLDPRSIELPVTPTVTSGGAAVLTLRQPDADPVLQEFR
jgi:LCP family protein required for cell wall assembly